MHVHVILLINIRINNMCKIKYMQFGAKNIEKTHTSTKINHNFSGKTMIHLYQNNTCSTFVSKLIHVYQRQDLDA